MKNIYSLFHLGDKIIIIVAMITTVFMTKMINIEIILEIKSIITIITTTIITTTIITTITIFEFHILNL